ncbi:helix-turn-helix domain-containing protein [Xinfangfangia sp. CPCC 101601]|uniref:Helix-turn-helix domain-containing protein n=1 Tax=Pseudogemmobacter lacusdianii TaxID=3069608 RepID=A0ABU0W410_9RHOB|nr:helix-turn-helix domain-containing protein [Xinfangfangia sp. CPCC 101601]MDQ2068200.1 helix-turn-helix domain-containing protein [Xinfangfangia sp. CPCC 101601]
MEETSQIAVLCIGEISLHTALLAVEPFRAANRTGGAKRFEISFLSIEGHIASTMVGIPLPTQSLADVAAMPELLFLLASYEDESLDKRALFAWLRRAKNAGSTIIGLDLAPFLMAEAGLLAHRAATAHWSTLNAFAERHPDIALTDRLFEIEGKIATSAGQIATLDLSMALLKARVPPMLYHAVQDELVYLPRVDNQVGQRRAGTDRQSELDPMLETAKAQMLAHIEDPLPLADIAAGAGLSLRDMQRRFRRETGQSPADYYRDLRLMKAVHLLLYSRLSIREVGLAAGFLQPATFFRAIRQRYNKGPQELRSSFLADNARPDGRKIGPGWGHWPV